jgi:hypothetical protein
MFFFHEVEQNCSTLLVPTIYCGSLKSIFWSAFVKFTFCYENVSIKLSEIGQFSAICIYLYLDFLLFVFTRTNNFCYFYVLVPTISAIYSYVILWVADYLEILGPVLPYNPGMMDGVQPPPLLRHTVLASWHQSRTIRHSHTPCDIHQWTELNWRKSRTIRYSDTACNIHQWTELTWRKSLKIRDNTSFSNCVQHPLIDWTELT